MSSKSYSVPYLKFGLLYLFCPLSPLQLCTCLLWTCTCLLWKYAGKWIRGHRGSSEGSLQGNSLWDLSTHPYASSQWMGNILLLALQEEKDGAGILERMAPFLTSLHPLCCRNPSSLACQLYYLPHAAVQTCSKTCTNVWSQKAQQQLCPNKIPQNRQWVGILSF